MDAFSWNLHTSMTTGVSASDAGKFDVEGVFSTSLVLKETGAIDAVGKEIILGFSDISKIHVICITSSIYDNQVELRIGEGAPPPPPADPDPDTNVTLSGPLILFGDAISKFTSSLNIITVTNNHDTEKANIQILIGRNLSA